MSRYVTAENICLHMVEFGPVDPYEIYKAGEALGFPRDEMRLVVLGLMDRDILRMNNNLRVYKNARNSKS